MNTYGIDVSHWSGKLDYAGIVKNGYGTKRLPPVFNFIKATEGTWFKDSLYQYHLEESKKAGILTGAYHYYREGYSPSNQGKLFAKVYNDNGGTDMPPVLDVEKINNSKLTPSAIHDCLNEIEEKTGRKPIIYTGFYVWRDMLKGSSFGKNYPLWIATYGNAPMIPPPWISWTFWQFSDAKGDENWYNGDVESLKKFCGISQEDKPWYDGLTMEQKVNLLLDAHPELEGRP